MQTNLTKAFYTSRLETWIVALDELAMPSEETTYWCSVHESFPLDTPKYLVAVSVHLIMHTLIIYSCFASNL